MSLSKQSIQIAQKEYFLEIFFLGDLMLFVPVWGIWGIRAASSPQSNV